MALCSSSDTPHPRFSEREGRRVDPSRPRRLHQPFPCGGWVDVSRPPRDILGLRLRRTPSGPPLDPHQTPAEPPPDPLRRRIFNSASSNDRFAPCLAVDIVSVVC
eukprot:1057995-Prorocentrum_minimum.AAC.2